MYKLILLCFFIPALLAYRDVHGNWKTHSGPNTASCPLNFEGFLDYLNINTKNITDGKTDFLLYYNKDNTTFANCTVKVSSVSCGVLTNRYECVRAPGLFFNYTSALINMTVDFTSPNQDLSLDFEWSDQDTIRKCQYVGTKSNLALPESTYTVENCSCLACCYKSGSRISISGLENIRNRPQIKIEGTLTGDYCENTMLENDFCLATSTSTKSIGDQVVQVSGTKCNSTTDCGLIGLWWGDDVRFNNRSGNYLSLQWENCVMYAYTGWGERIGLALIGVLAIFVAF